MFLAVLIKLISKLMKRFTLSHDNSPSNAPRPIDNSNEAKL